MLRYVRLTFLLLFISCDPVDNRLVVVNKTDKIIYYYFNDQSDTLNIERIYTFNEKELDSVKASETDSLGSEKLLQLSTSNIGLTSSTWEAEEFHSSNKRIYIFFVEKNIKEKYTWREIMRLRKYRKGSYTVEFFKEKKWKIKYPDDTVLP